MKIEIEVGWPGGEIQAQNVVGMSLSNTSNSVNGFSK